MHIGRGRSGGRNKAGCLKAVVNGGFRARQARLSGAATELVGPLGRRDVQWGLPIAKLQSDDEVPSPTCFPLPPAGCCTPYD